MGERSPDGSISSLYEGIWRRKAGTPSSPSVPEVGTARESLAVPFLRPGLRILDVGCGTGALFELAPSPRLIVGVDIARNALLVAQARGHRVLRAHLDGPYLPFTPASFDAVTCLAVLEHLIDPRHLLREIRKVLVPHGVIVVLVPNIRHYYRLFELLVRGRFPRTSGDPESIDGGHVRYFAPADLRALLLSEGFEDVELQGTGGVRFWPAFRSLEILATARRGD